MFPNDFETWDVRYEHNRPWVTRIKNHLRLYTNWAYLRGIILKFLTYPSYLHWCHQRVLFADP
ncbi:hypothetical protein ATG66_0454 [Vibrio sp. ES.051]|nr:hypothetical protein ATG66_0454 [Vibrio sp. ES.051]